MELPPPLPYLPVEDVFNEAVTHAGGYRVDSMIPDNANFDNADYYFESDRLFAELKELHYDANEDEALRARISSLYSKFESLGKVAPLSPGQTPIRIDLLPEECRREFIRLFQRKLEGPVKKAARQLKQTKEAFNLEDAYGVLLLVNEGSTFLRPEVTLFFLSRILTGQYSSIDNVVYCSINTGVVSAKFPYGARFWYSATVQDRRSLPEAFLQRLYYHLRCTIDHMIGLSGPIYSFPGDHALINELVFEKPPTVERDSFYIQPNRFYVCPDNGFKYYCDSVSKGTAKIFLVESYQNGQVIQALFKQKLIHANARNYHVITDSEEIARLKRIVKRLKRGEEANCNTNQIYRSVELGADYVSMWVV